MAERTNAQLLKSCEVQASVGSNPTPSARLDHGLSNATGPGDRSSRAHLPADIAESSESMTARSMEAAAMATKNPTGKAILKASLQLFRQDRQMIWLPVMATVAALLAFGIVTGPL